MLEIILMVFLVVCLFIIVVALSLLFVDFEKDKCGKCGKKIAHKGYSFVYCKDCDYTTYYKGVF